MNGEKTKLPEELTLRDYFAAHAPEQEIVAMAPDTVETCSKFLGIKGGEYKGDIHYPTILAKVRYQWADAMLKERTAK